MVFAYHLFGYVKEIDRSIRNNLENKDLYELGDLLGWSGLENTEAFLQAVEVHIFMKLMPLGAGWISNRA